jgi:hypothetical protein
MVFQMCCKLGCKNNRNEANRVCGSRQFHTLFFFDKKSFSFWIEKLGNLLVDVLTDVFRVSHKLFLNKSAELSLC